MEREEAIEVIRKNYPHVGNSGTEFETALRELIPELKESEDERIRREIYNFLIDMECKEEWINYLEKQKVQKPAEWSEKDNVQLNAAIQIVSNSGHYTTANWLKSLRPQPYWKPSEEQIGALNEIINVLAVSKHPHENDYLFNILSGLRKNLKSL